MRFSALRTRSGVMSSRQKSRPGLLYPLAMRSLLIASATLATAVVAAAATVSAPPRVIVGDTALDGLRMSHATPPQAVKRLGKPSRLVPLQPTVCRGIWKRLGLTPAFFSLRGRPRSPGGRLLTATVTSRGAWRTAVGLRVGDASSRIRTLYPRSVFHKNPPAGYWLLTRKTCPIGGSVPYASLLARVHDDRVS